jgi:ligand-binding sensor domain-containing protein
LAYNFDENGYYIDVKDGVSIIGKDANITSTSTGRGALIKKSNNLEQTSQVQAQIGMYNSDSDTFYWLSSPSATDRRDVMLVVGGNYNEVWVGDWRGLFGACAASPMISLKYGVTVELELENE